MYFPEFCNKRVVAEESRFWWLTSFGDTAIQVFSILRTKFRIRQRLIRIVSGKFLGMVFKHFEPV
jgi:hypothetical protein